MTKATAVAHPNIAFIKYWGKADAELNLPANPSLSMNLAGLTTATTVEFQSGLAQDLVVIDDQPATGQALARVVAHLDRVRTLAGIADRAVMVSRSNFPAGTGLASSASAFAALSVAAAWAAGLNLDEAGLSRLARMGSGSACRSVPAGFVMWDGDRADSSFGRQVAPPEHWELHDLIAVVSEQHKTVGSYDGHRLAGTSPLYTARRTAVPELLSSALAGIAQRDLAVLGPALEADALAMHAVMITSRPALFYWEPATMAVLHTVQRWQRDGIGVYFTMDAGPNVHCLCKSPDAVELKRRLGQIPGVREVLDSRPGGGARIIEYHQF